MSKHTPTPWTLGRTSKRSQTVYIDAMHQDPDLKHMDWRDMIACAGCYDLPDNGIEKAEANARHIVKAVNYHERLVEALREVTAVLAWVAHGECRAIQDDPIMPSAQAQEVARALLAELDNLEKQQ